MRCLVDNTNILNNNLKADDDPPQSNTVKPATLPVEDAVAPPEECSHSARPPGL